ncbi:MAG: glycosyltransferase [Bacteroidetes bacterium]|nr:glycosyltransferase [Bacteroidota bacterium]
MDENLSEKRQVNKVLWLTDTYGDHNGVSMVLQSIHSEIVLRNLPVDIMVCSNDLKSDKHLIVLKPLSEFNIPLYRQQPMRIPNFLTIQRIFRKRKYDRIICSTEGPMGFAALYLKKLYSVKTYFYLHTDWIMFARQVMGMEDKGVSRLQRVMKTYYNQFDNIFVLNSDQQKWFTGHAMKFDPSRILMTAHWTENIFLQNGTSSNGYLDAIEDPPVLLYAGRLSREKGIFELPGIFKRVRDKIPGLKMLIAGTGPAEKELKAVFPEAEYTGWIDHSRLPEIYRSAGLLILPSRFDTFSCVVLEALSCGLPVIAYNTKGPKDIIQDSVNGFLAETDLETSERIIDYFSDRDLRLSFKQAALQRANDYSADNILKQFLLDIGIQPLSAADGTKAA